MATLWTLLKFLPELVAILKAITKKVSEGIDEAQIRASLKAFDAGLSKAIETKDTTDLENVFRGKVK
jgi:hypothetical protein